MAKGKPDAMDAETMRVQAERLELMKGQASELAATLKEADSELQKVIRGEWSGYYHNIESLRDDAGRLVDFLKEADSLLNSVIQKMGVLKYEAEEAKRAMDDLNG